MTMIEAMDACAAMRGKGIGMEGNGARQRFYFARSKPSDDDDGDMFWEWRTKDTDEPSLVKVSDAALRSDKWIIIK